MLTSITPLGERGRHRRWSVTVTAYAAGSTVAGAMMGGALGLLPAPPPRAALVVLAVACALAAALDMRPSLLPTVRRQVNEDWLVTYRGWVCGVGFGTQLGLGVVTIVTTASVYVVLLAAGLSGRWSSGAVVGATFGLLRATPTLLLWSVTSTARLIELSGRLARWAGPATRLTTALLSGIAVLCASVAVAG